MPGSDSPWPGSVAAIKAEELAGHLAKFAEVKVRRAMLECLQTHLGILVLGADFTSTAG